MHPNFTTILRPFHEEGFEEDSYMRQSDLARVLDRCISANTKDSKFDRQIFRELWENTLKNEEGDCVLLKDYVQTICEAQDILKEKIRRTQDKYAAEINEQKKREYMVTIYSLSQDQKSLNSPFGLGEQQPSKLIQMSRLSVSPNDKTSLSIFTDGVTLEHKLSISLSLVAYLGFISFVLQLLCMLGKFNFFGLLVDILVLAIFLLNYFDRVYIRFIFLNLLLSVIVDSAWLAMMIDDYWHPSVQNWNASRPGFLRFIIVASFLACICKFISALLLLKFRGNPHGLRKKANFVILEFNLDANPLRNPITAAVQKVFPKFLIH